MNIIVLGAAEPLGRRVARQLVDLGHQVTITAAARRAGALPFGAVPLDDQVTVIDGHDATALRAAIRRQDVVCGLTQVIDPPASTLAHLLRTPSGRPRRRMLHDVVSALRGQTSIRWIQRSSAAIYRDAGHRWLVEDWPIAPNAATTDVLDGEHAAREYTGRGGTSVVLRMAWPYGPDDPCTRRLVATARNGWLPLHGPNLAYFPTISLDDAARAVIAALTAPPDVYNIGDTQPSTIGQLADGLASALGRRSSLQPLQPALRSADREIVGRSHRLDATAFALATGWLPTAEIGLAGVARVLRDWTPPTNSN